MKVIAVSGDKKFYKIGEDSQSSKWYGVGEPVKNFMGSINKGDEVSIKFEKDNAGKNLLTFIKKSGSGGGEPSTTTKTPGGSSYSAPRNNDVQESIVKQTIGKMVAMTIQGLDGVDLTNVDEVIDSLFAKYKEKVG